MMKRVLLVLILAVPASAEPRLDRHGDPLPDGAIARFGTIRYRIGSTRVLYSFAVSPDCKSLAAEDARGITLWDLETGKPRVQTRPTPSDGAGPNYALLYSPDGTKIARLAGKNVDVIDGETGRELFRHRLPGEGKAHAVAFSADASRIAVGLEGRDRIYSFDTSNPRRLEEKNVELPVWQFLTSAKWAIARNDAGLHLLNIDTGKIRCSFAETKGLAIPMAIISSDERRVYISGRSASIQVFDAVSGKRLEKFAPPAGWGKPDFADFPSEFAVSPDESIAYITKHEQKTQRLDLKTGKWLEPMPVSLGGSIFASRDGKCVVIVEADGVVRRIDPQTLKELPAPEGFEDCVFARPSPDGRRVLAQYETASGYRIDVYDLDGKRLWSQQPKEWASARWNRDGRLIACIGRETIELRDAATGKVAHTLRSGLDRGEFTHVFFSDKPDTLVALIDFGQVVAIFDTRSGEQKRLVFAKFGSAMSLSPDGDKLLYSREVATRLFDLDSERFVATLDVPSRELGLSRSTNSEDSFRFSPDGSFILSWRQTEKGKVPVLRHPDTLDEFRALDISIAGSFEYAISPNGLWLAVGDRSGAVSMYDVSTGARFGTWAGQKDYFTSIEFAGCVRILTSSADLTAILWEPRPDKRPTKPLWEALSSQDGLESYRAIWALADDPKAAELLREKIVPSDRVSSEQLKRWIDDLGSNRFATRETATKSLKLMGRGAERELRDARSKTADAEVRSRIDALLAQVRHERSHLDVIHARAVTALELNGSDAAKKLLKEWASGAPSARLTMDSKAARLRLHPSR